MGEEESLTHYGQSISEIEQFDDDPRSDDEGEGKQMKQAVKSKGLKLSQFQNCLFCCDTSYCYK